MEGGGNAVDSAEARMLAGLETLGQVREAMKKRLGAMQAQVARQPIPAAPKPVLEHGTLNQMLFIRDQIAAQTRAVQYARGAAGEGAVGAGALVEALDALVGLQQELISMTLLPAMLQVGHDEKQAADDRQAAARNTSAVQDAVNVPKMSVPKSEQERAEVIGALGKLAVMLDVRHEDVCAVADAMSAQHYAPDSVIVRQGDEGDRFYLVTNGSCDVYRNEEGGAGRGQHVGTVGGALAGFGELALLYGEARSATVVARTEATVWSVGESVIGPVLLAAQAKRRSLYMGMLGRFPVLSMLTPSKKGRVADVMGSRSFADGEVIIEQGEEGHLIFFIEDGSAVATRSRGGQGDSPVRLASYGRWSYFGELALLTGKPRAATVTAVGATKVCFIDRHAVTRLLGPCMEIIIKTIESYRVQDEPPSPQWQLPHIQQHSVPHSSRRGGVSGHSWSSVSPPGPEQPEYPKSQAEADGIKDAIRDMFLFSHLEEPELDNVAGAFFEVAVRAGEDIIRQGDEGDNFYLVHDGEFEVWIASGVNNKVVSTLRKGNFFGELALMYNCPRSATIRAVADGRLYALGQHIFHHILRSSAQDRRVQYDQFLQRVPILQGLTGEERGKIADVLVQSSFCDEEYIVRQGDKWADSFFIVLEGSATARKSYSGTAPVEVMRYKRGDYFGEVALQNNVDRCADVIASGDCKVVSIDKMSFSRLLGHLPPRTYL